ncbi:MAG: phosphatase PAP2 family protein [Acidobacteria bacterium]|nr:phosphatase PAP2 family protein [Acidobacteriota bacterium]
MSSRRQTFGRGVRALLLLTAVLAGAAGASAQSPSPSPSPTPQASPTPSLEKRFFKNIVRDQGAIWTSPFHLGRDDAKWAVPLGLSMAALLATDQETGEFGSNRTRASVSRDVSLAGSTYGTAGVAAAFYLAGRATGNARARETGLLGAEALIDGGVVFSVLKNVSQRQRPGHDEGQGEFFDGGHSFPSGHATGAWALATVVANEYRNHRLVQVGAYGLATAVSISRFTGRNHFLGDVLVGSAIGYGVGRYVYRTHHDQSLDSGDGQTAQHTRSRLLPFVAPQYSRGTRTYGMTLAWDF